MMNTKLYLRKFQETELSNSLHFYGNASRMCNALIAKALG